MWLLRASSARVLWTHRRQRHGPGSLVLTPQPHPLLLKLFSPSPAGGSGMEVSGRSVLEDSNLPNFPLRLPRLFSL